MSVFLSELVAEVHADLVIGSLKARVPPTGLYSYILRGAGMIECLGAQKPFKSLISFSLLCPPNLPYFPLNFHELCDHFLMFPLVPPL